MKKFTASNGYIVTESGDGVIYLSDTEGRYLRTIMTLEGEQDKALKEYYENRKTEATAQEARERVESHVQEIITAANTLKAEFDEWVSEERASDCPAMSAEAYKMVQYIDSYVDRIHGEFRAHRDS